MLKIGDVIHVLSVSERENRGDDVSTFSEDLKYTINKLAEKPHRVASIECETLVSMFDTWQCVPLNDVVKVDDELDDGFDELSFKVGDSVIMTSDETVIGMTMIDRNRIVGQICTIDSMILDEGVFRYRITTSDGHMYEVGSDAIVCGLDENPDYIPPAMKPVRSCRNCGSLFLEPENVFEEDFGLCPECAKRRFVTPYHCYNKHLQFLKSDKDAKPLYIGLELEIDGGGERNSNAATAMDIMNTDETMFIHCSHDGSLSDGFEIITQPATLEYHEEMREKYKKLFKEMVRLGYRSHGTSTCGLHYHIDRGFFDGEDETAAFKILYLVEKFWDEMTIFSRRDYRSLERYAKKVGGDLDDFLCDFNKSNDHDGHYYAVNVSNENTIELRMFRGTMNLNTFLQR